MSICLPPRPASRTVTSGRSASALARSVAPRFASSSPVSRTSVSRSNGLSGRSAKISIASPSASFARSSSDSSAGASCADAVPVRTTSTANHRMRRSYSPFPLPAQCPLRTIRREVGTMLETSTNGERHEDIISNQDTIRENQDRILKNQEKILANQERIKGNQDQLAKILANQKTMMANQKKLDQVLANQKTIQA